MVFNRSGSFFYSMVFLVAVGWCGRQEANMATDVLSALHIIDADELEGTHIFGDIEGKWDLLVKSLSGHNALLELVEGILKFKKKAKKALAIFLGDMTDKGRFNQSILRQTLALCEDPKTAARVVAILGNRDINKLRFLWEFKRDALDLAGKDKDGKDKPGFDKFRFDRFRIGSWEKLFEKFSNSQDCSVDGVRVEYSHGQNVLQDRILKMKFLCRDTLGAGTLFTDIKAENNFETDAQAYHEMIRMIKPGGEWARYLKIGKLAHFDEATGSLYVHGGVTETNFLRIPGRAKTAATVNEWVHELNEWAGRCIDSAYDGDYEMALPLIRAQEPPVEIDENGITRSARSSNPESVIHGRPWSDVYNITVPGESVTEVLAQNGVKRVFSGHSPIGHAAGLFRAKHGVNFIFGDTSASDQQSASTITCNQKEGVVISTTCEIDGKMRTVIARESDPRVGVQDELGKWSLGVDEENNVVKSLWDAPKGGPGGFGKPNYTVDPSALIQ